MKSIRLTLLIAAAALPALADPKRGDDPPKRNRTQPGPARAHENTGGNHGELKGIATYQGRIPKIHVRDDLARRRDLLTVDPRTRALRYVLVYLENVASTARKSQAPNGNLNVAPDSPPVIDQLHHTFVPHMIAVRSGRRVRITNSDLANHNVRALSIDPRNEFNIYIGPDAGYEHRFHTNRQYLPVRLNCDVHPWMRGWIYVFDHPYVAVTDETGAFRIPSVPPGRHKVTALQPDVGYTHTREIEIAPGQVTEVEIRVNRKDLKLPD